MTRQDTDLRVRVVPQNGDALCIEVVGEADFATHLELKAALARIHLGGTGPVRLRLDRLTFCDVLAFRHLVAFASLVRDHHRDLRTFGASYAVRLMSSVHGTDPLLNLV
jgi:anti-anti-sigma regulatory factor